MEIYISEESFIYAIQEDFNKAWPHLKLEFYKNPHGVYEGNVPYEKLDPAQPIDEIRNIHCSAWIDISSHITVKELESQFLHMLGLNVQVFRKSGHVWLETTATDDRTLGEQEALAISND